MIVLMTILRTLGQVLISMLMELVTGRALKQLFLWPLRWFSKKTATPEDDKVVDRVAEDWKIEEGGESK